MIAICKPATAQSATDAWHDAFLEMLPGIYRQARIAFRHLKPEAREEAVREVVAHVVTAFKAHWDQDKAELAYPRCWPCTASSGSRSAGRSAAS